MATLLSNLTQRIRQVYKRAGDFIEEEREFPVSQVFLNATFKRYVTDNVDLLKDLHADLHDAERKARQEALVNANDAAADAQHIDPSSEHA